MVKIQNFTKLKFYFINNCKFDVNFWLGNDQVLEIGELHLLQIDWIALKQELLEFFPGKKTGTALFSDTDNSQIIG